MTEITSVTDVDIEGVSSIERMSLPSCCTSECIEPKDVMQTLGTSCYIDMGVLYGNYVVGQCIVWWPEPVHIDEQKISTFLDALFDQLKLDGATEVELSFAQINDIEALNKGTKGSPQDTISIIQTDNYPVGSTTDNFLMYFINKAHEAGVKVDLSFGGAIATEENMKFGSSPDVLANTLVDFLNKYSFDAVDFDIEGTGLAIMKVNTEEEVTAFFKTLHDALASHQKTSTITLAGSIADGPEGALSALFDNFTSYFDGVNLMLYSNTQYYLDAENPTWGIKEWLSYVKESSLIHMGFYDEIPYENPDASAGEKYQIPEGLTRGEAAAFVYLQVIKDLGDSASSFGEPFFWTDDPTKLSTDEILQDFFIYLKAHS